MKEKLIATVGKQITNFPRIKKMLISFIDFFLEYKMILVGNLTRNPAYLRHVFTSKVLAKPGTLSFGAIFNPGVLWADDHVVLLAKAQKIPWFKTGGAKRHLYLQGSPVVLLLDKNTLEVVAQNVVPSVLGFPQELIGRLKTPDFFIGKEKKWSTTVWWSRVKFRAILTKPGCAQPYRSSMTKRNLCSSALCHTWISPCRILKKIGSTKSQIPICICSIL